MALDELHSGWVPERVGELPLDATIAVIRSVGVVDPVLLRPLQTGGYEVVAGHRTVAAARDVGLASVPAIVRRLDDGGALMALALDGTASGRLTVEAADELRRRLAVAGVDAEDVDDVMAAVPVAAAAAVAEPEPIATAAEPEAAPAVATPEPEPVPVGAAEPEAERVAVAAPAGAAPPPVAAAPLGVEHVAAAASRWIPLPAGRPRLARLSSAFADAPRMLRLLAADRFTGTVELTAPDGRRDAVTFLEGACIATSVEVGGRRVPRPLRLPTPDDEPPVEITVRPHPPAVVVALSLALRAPARLVGLDAAFLHFPGLIATLARSGTDAAVVVSAPLGGGVVLISGGEPISAYARREGEEPGEAAETTDVAAVADLLADGEGEVDVHDGPLVEPLDLEEVMAGAVAGR